MVGRVLTGNGITAYGNGAYSLIGGDELSDTERDALLQLCRRRLGPRHSGSEIRHRPADHSTGCLAGVRRAQPLPQSRDRQPTGRGGCWMVLSEPEGLLH